MLYVQTKKRCYIVNKEKSEMKAKIFKINVKIESKNSTAVLEDFYSPKQEQSRTK